MSDSRVLFDEIQSLRRQAEEKWNELLAAEAIQDQIGKEIDAAQSSGAILTEGICIERYGDAFHKVDTLYHEWEQLVKRAETLIEEDIARMKREQEEEWLAEN